MGEDVVGSRDEIAKANSGEGDEGEITCIQEAPIFLPLQVDGGPKHHVQSHQHQNDRDWDNHL